MMSYKSIFLYFVVPAAMAAVAPACSRDDSAQSFATAKGSALHRAESCDDLLWQIQNDAIDKLDAQVEMYKSVEYHGYFGGGITGRATDDASGDGSGAPSAQDSGGSLDGGGTGESSAPGSHSETNTQVAGVDEADIVKTDGQKIYLLHGSDFYILDAWPADETRELGHTTVEGSGFELFVADGRATVFSTVHLDEAGGGGSSDYPASSDCYDCYGGGSVFTKISVYDVTGTSPVLQREMLFEGSYVSARRHGDVVRTVVQGGFKAPQLYYPNINPYDTFGREKTQAELEEELDDWRNEVAEDIETTELTDWVPRRFERKDGALSELPMGCGDYYVPEPGRTESGVTQVVTFDAQATEAPQVTAILGGAEHVYANHEVVVLAQTDYSWYFRGAEETRTSLHQFRIESASTSYEASGFIPGYLHDQFSIDERRGVIRVSTTQETRLDPQNEPWLVETSNLVVTLERQEKELSILDQTEPLAPGETIFSTRFVGDRGYVVTFRQTDPLFVVDLSEPSDLKVLGELHIPGFSDYMHPIQGNFLLTIGQDADDSGVTSGAALQVFDVTDPTDPRLVHKHAFGGFSHSEANHNHKAFTYVDDYFGEDRGLLMFPIVSYEPQYRTSLEIVQVSTLTGFDVLSSVDHSPLINRECADFESTGVPCYYYGGNEMRRGVQIDDYVYAISQGGVTVHSFTDLDTEVARVELPQPKYDYDYGDGGSVEPLPAPPEMEPSMGGSSGQ